MTISGEQPVLRFLKYWLWDIEKAPDKIGPIGFAIMGVFLAFCIGMLMYHDKVHR